MTAAQRLDERPEHGNPAAAERGRVRGHLACGRVAKFQSTTLVKHGGVTYESEIDTFVANRACLFGAAGAVFSVGICDDPQSSAHPRKDELQWRAIRNLDH
jgi:hypothetical protein